MAGNKDVELLVQLSGMPYNQKWDILKDELEALFYTHRVNDIAELIKKRFGFDA
jgi:hypothetical protein